MKFKRMDSSRRFSASLSDLCPQLGERSRNTNFDRHYIYHTAWAARVLAETRPLKHVDISSSLFFIGIASAFIPIDFYDYRPAQLRMEGVCCRHADLLRLPFEDGSIGSLSCMHTIEHIGLGRYGDAMDPEGDLKAIRELKRSLAPGGSLLIAVPIGVPRILFNAHRVYSYEQILSHFEGLTLKEFALIPANEARGGLVRNAPPSMVADETYACGCFWFTK
ncbi:MAG: DUF268 domain-containing protein [Terriglobia bacterium]